MINQFIIHTLHKPTRETISNNLLAPTSAYSQHKLINSTINWACKHCKKYIVIVTGPVYVDATSPAALAVIAAIMQIQR